MNDIYKAILAFFLVMTVAGCAREVDFYPVVLTISVVDGDGNDLLDSESPLFVGDRLSLEFRNRSYVLAMPDTKTYMPDFKGLQLICKDGLRMLSFGELDGESDYDDDFILNLPDGSTRTIHYDRRVNYNLLLVKDKWTLDGDRTECPVTVEWE